ncbi:MAG: rod shape-determining protein MreC [Elusimicrobia bacterium GWC2_65_9]|nr:MAG: rod shape-determining protein MreC [Elusimicrobia bacterium GWA2_66_18]OGR73854.1 MAG: rod shape-determining protein MreC [Elusimicrobia bacterium GWC2_65_9]
MLTTLSLVLLSMPLSSPVRSAKALASYIFDPISYEGERGAQKMAGVPARVRELLTADLQNRILQEELRGITWIKLTIESLSLENKRLRRALGLKMSSGRHPIWAHVMERDPLHWYRSVSVDAGSDLDVSLNDPVLGRNGDVLVAVGRVVEVRPRTSTVLLLSDERSAVAAYLSSATLEGLAQGQDSPHLRMNYINAEAKLFLGDFIYTSPTSATFPPDVLIGRVAKVYPRDPFLTFQAVEVAPFLDATSLQEVLILRTRQSEREPAAEEEPAGTEQAPR